MQNLTFWPFLKSIWYSAIVVLTPTKACLQKKHHHLVVSWSISQSHTVSRGLTTAALSLEKLLTTNATETLSSSFSYSSMLLSKLSGGQKGGGRWWHDSEPEVSLNYNRRTKWGGTSKIWEILLSFCAKYHMCTCYLILTKEQLVSKTSHCTSACYLQRNSASPT